MRLGTSPLTGRDKSGKLRCSFGGQVRGFCPFLVSAVRAAVDSVGRPSLLTHSTERSNLMRKWFLALAFIVLPLAFAAPALAVPPTTEVFVVDNDTSVNTSLCGFPITFTQNGTFKVITYYDSAGNPIKSILTNYKVRFTETATANGKTLLANFPTVYITSSDGTTVESGLRSA